jgi:protein-L-isoaspartate(D-aspartate) O-methyltransferase
MQDPHDPEAAACTGHQKQRDNMLRKQMAARGISNPRVLEAMGTVHRHHFVPDAHQDSAYGDHPIKIACGQTISQPYIVALMTQLLDPQPNERILEIGSGYQTAVLAYLAKEVVSIERHDQLGESAASRLKALGYSNATVRCRDGSLGAPDKAPYDAIIVTAATPEIPNALCQQLAEGGRLLCPTGSRKVQTLTKLTRKGSDFTREENIKCVFVPLIGKDGWAPTEEHP